MCYPVCDILDAEHSAVLQHFISPNIHMQAATQERQESSRHIGKSRYKMCWPAIRKQEPARAESCLRHLECELLNASSQLRSLTLRGRILLLLRMWCRRAMCPIPFRLGCGLLHDGLTPTCQPTKVPRPFEAVCEST
jgi:hypothetical protein